MKAQIVKGTKEQIADIVARINGEVREAVVFVEEPYDLTPRASGEDIFAEMEPFTVRSGGTADYSRETLYARTDGE